MAVFGRRLGLPPVRTKMSPDATGYGRPFVGPDAATATSVSTLFELMQMTMMMMKQASGLQVGRPRRRPSWTLRRFSMVMKQASCLQVLGAASSHSGTWCVTHSKFCEDPSRVAAFLDGNGGVMLGMVVNGGRKEVNGVSTSLSVVVEGL